MEYREKLAVKEDVCDSWATARKTIAEAVLNFGKCSSNYLVRKIKCTPEMAEKLISLYEEDKLFRDLQRICEVRANNHNEYYRTL